MVCIHKIILFWTKYFDETIEQYFKITAGPVIIDNEYCGLTSLTTPCWVTSNKRHVNNSHAIVFHWRDINARQRPRYRRPDQLWTLYNMEAPPNTPYHTFDNDIDNKFVFNMTATYRPDSDLYVPYGRVVKVADKDTDESVNDLMLNANFNNKTKLIAWIVSHCDTSGGRQQYVRELQEYITVDVYGGCGPYDCQPRRSVHCMQNVANSYMFYLSFENSVC
ncbi:unnamed protein product, partial [Medioppia subpectinata]